MDYNDFRKTVLKTEEKHHFTATNSNGTREAWRWIKKNKWLGMQPISERDFGKIIKAINQSLQDQLLQGRDVILPHKMGKLEIRKYKTSVQYKEGKLVTNLPVNWGATLKLWYEDKEAHDNKTLIRFEIKEKFTIYYNKTTVAFNNKSFYQFIPTRTFKQNLKQRIEKGDFDAPLLGKKYGLC